MVMAIEEQRFMVAADQFPLPPGIRFSYGTAGFRLEASLLRSTVFRMGMLAALRSVATGKITGLVVTASHNHVSDNGVKLVDPTGEMLLQAWEAYADELANAPDSASLLKVLNAIVGKETIRPNALGRVLLGRDTRPSGAALVDAAKKGIDAINGLHTDMGILTTPQLHWMVREMNLGHSSTESAYFRRFSESFKNLLKLNPSRLRPHERRVVVDGANGVGAQKLEQLQVLLDDLALEIRNAGEGELNGCVGADFVQKEKTAPKGFSASSDIGNSCVSIDGDADRLVYFYFSNGKALHLLDGDKILSLFACFLQQQLEQVGYETLKFGVVQTAYANGASTRYLKDKLGLEVSRTPTGVKYLQEEAKNFDVGLYFEANGHGTILFGEQFLEFLRTEASGELRAAMDRLLAVSELVNQAIGDAISGLLMVEAALVYLGWSLEDWDEIYADLPSRQLKVKVKDRQMITTTEAETKVARPHGLQQAIDIEIAKHCHGRAFTRPSGTEDVVRVYAEAETQQGADELAAAVAALVHQFAGGV